MEPPLPGKTDDPIRVDPTTGKQTKLASVPGLEITRIVVAENPNRARNVRSEHR